jgi:hypothetical protein
LSLKRKLQAGLDKATTKKGGQKGWAYHGYPLPTQPNGGQKGHQATGTQIRSRILERPLVAWPFRDPKQ